MFVMHIFYTWYLKKAIKVVIIKMNFVPVEWRLIKLSWGWIVCCTSRISLLRRGLAVPAPSRWSVRTGQSSRLAGCPLQLENYKGKETRSTYLGCSLTCSTCTLDGVEEPDSSSAPAWSPHARLCISFYLKKKVKNLAWSAAFRLDF